jgi:hypothetical protein
MVAAAGVAPINKCNGLDCQNDPRDTFDQQGHFRALSNLRCVPLAAADRRRDLMLVEFSGEPVRLRHRQDQPQGFRFAHGQICRACRYLQERMPASKAIVLRGMRRVGQLRHRQHADGEIDVAL